MRLLMASIGLITMSKVTAGPREPCTRPTLLVMPGGTSAVGSVPIKLTSQSSIHPIIYVVGCRGSFVEILIDNSQRDMIIHYRNAPGAVISGIQEALASQHLLYAFDTISRPGTEANVSSVLNLESDNNTSPFFRTG
jgi:hypothetical protein